MRIPVTVAFDDSRQVGFVEFTDEFKDTYEKMLVDAGPGSEAILVLSPGYISDFPDENGRIKSAELIEFGVIPAFQLHGRKK